MSRFWFICLLLVAASATGAASVFQDHSFYVARAGSAVEVVWSTSNETGISQFVVFRKTATTDAWQPVYIQTPLGAGYQYHWLDETAFKTTDNLYQYFIRAQFSDRQDHYEDTPIDRTTSGSTSGVRRTWGSIKAMFR